MKLFPKKIIQDKSGFLTILGLLAAVCIVLFLSYHALTVYFGRNNGNVSLDGRESNMGLGDESSQDEGAQKDLKEAVQDKELYSQNAVSVSGYRGIVEKSEKAIEEINKQTIERQKHYEDWQ